MSKRCDTCHKPIRATEAALYTNTAAGVRAQVHIKRLREGAQAPKPSS